VELNPSNLIPALLISGSIEEKLAYYFLKSNAKNLPFSDPNPLELFSSDW